MCPTPEEIIQWLWTIIGTGGKGAVFWTLNSRSSGIEAGEWALLDFQNQSTSRLHAAKDVAQCLKEHEDCFRNARKYHSQIHLLYIRESLWGESVIAPAGRACIMKNLLGYFKALSEKGIAPSINAIDEFDFKKDDYTGECIVLAHQIVMPQRYIRSLESFVSKGGTLIVDGLTGYYDEYLQCRALVDDSLRQLFGGRISEWIHHEEMFNLICGNKSLSAYGWKGYIIPNENSVAMSSENSKPLAIEHAYGRGKVYWIPSLIGMSGKDNGLPLISWLEETGISSLQENSFLNFEPDMMMKLLQTDKGFIRIVINKSSVLRRVKLSPSINLSYADVWFANKGGYIDGSNICIHPEETIVIYSKKQ